MGPYKQPPACPQPPSEGISHRRAERERERERGGGGGGCKLPTSASAYEKIVIATVQLRNSPSAGVIGARGAGRPQDRHHRIAGALTAARRGRKQP